MKYLAFVLLLAVVSGCGEPDATIASHEERMASLDRTLERQHDAETLVSEVDTWIVHTSTLALAGDRERVERLTAGLKSRLARVKPALGRKAFSLERSSALERELADLRDGYGRAVAAIPTERRAAEERISQSMKSMGEQMTEYRVEVASFSVQGNAEIKRRVSQLELGRREMTTTLIELRHAEVERWATIQRRWNNQHSDWRDDYRLALERLKKIAPTKKEEMRLE